MPQRKFWIFLSVFCTVSIGLGKNPVGVRVLPVNEGRAVIVRAGSTVARIDEFRGMEWKTDLASELTDLFTGSGAIIAIGKNWNSDLGLPYSGFITLDLANGKILKTGTVTYADLRGIAALGDRLTFLSEPARILDADKNLSGPLTFNEIADGKIQFPKEISGFNDVLLATNNTGEKIVLAGYVGDGGVDLKPHVMTFQRFADRKGLAAYVELRQATLPGVPLQLDHHAGKLAISVEGTRTASILELDSESLAIEKNWPLEKNFNQFHFTRTANGDFVVAAHSNFHPERGKLLVYNSLGVLQNSMSFENSGYQWMVPLAVAPAADDKFWLASVGLRDRRQELIVQKIDPANFKFETRSLEKAFILPVQNYLVRENILETPSQKRYREIQSSLDKLKKDSAKLKSDAEELNRRSNGGSLFPR